MTKVSSGGMGVLFNPISVGPLALENRLVMAPMTRSFSPQGVPNEDVAQYYRRRAEGGIGLIVTEGTWIPHSSASNDSNVPCFYGEEALQGWKRVVEEVHAVGGRIVPQLWHVGQVAAPSVDMGVGGGPQTPQDSIQLGPSGMGGGIGDAPSKRGEAMTTAEVDEIIDAFATAAVSAKELGFDGLELHGAHGYLIDQFFWSITNLRSDKYGGDLVDRTRFAVEVVQEIRRRVGREFPIIFRYSQWKVQDYAARLVESPQELESFLGPIADAGVDCFHCSQRRFWETEFDGSLNLAGWTKKLTGLPTISVGSVGLSQDFVTSILMGAPEQTTAESTNLNRLVAMMEREEFDLIAIGRALLSDPAWAAKTEQGQSESIVPYSNDALLSLS